MGEVFRLRETARPRRGEKLDPVGNLTFGVGLTILLAALTYALLPYGDALTGWRNPWVIGGIVLGAALLLCFPFVETRVNNPMFQLDLFRIRAFAAGNLAGWVAGIARSGVQLMLVIWLQGVWLPLHSYPFAETPQWAGIYMLPMMIDYLVGPLSGYLSDRYGARLFATAGMVPATAAFVLLAQLPADFEYLPFAIILLILALDTWNRHGTVCLSQHQLDDKFGARTGSAEWPPECAQRCRIRAWCYR